MTGSFGVTRVGSFFYEKDWIREKSPGLLERKNKELPPVYKGEAPFDAEDLFGLKRDRFRTNGQQPVNSSSTEPKRRYYQPHVCPHEPQCPHRAACEILTFLKSDL